MTNTHAITSQVSAAQPRFLPRLKGSSALIIFDLDGTLIDSRKDIAAAVNAARSFFLLPELSLEEVVSMVGDGIDMLAQRCFRNTSVAPQDALREIMTHYQAHPVEETVLYKGVAEVLPRLRTLRAIISNKPIELIRRILEKLGIQRFFQFTAGGDSFESRKPDPEAIEILLDQFQVRRDRTLVVGDHRNDMEMARRAGVKGVYCRYGFFDQEKVEAAYQIQSFPELLPLVEGLGLNRPE